MSRRKARQPTLYERLGITDPNVSTDVIQDAYTAASLATTDPEELKQLRFAYGVLMDPDRRMVYDHAPELFQGDTLESMGLVDEYRPAGLPPTYQPDHHPIPVPGPPPVYYRPRRGRAVLIGLAALVVVVAGMVVFGFMKGGSPDKPDSPTPAGVPAQKVDGLIASKVDPCREKAHSLNRWFILKQLSSTGWQSAEARSGYTYGGRHGDDAEMFGYQAKSNTLQAKTVTLTGLVATEAGAKSDKPVEHYYTFEQPKAASRSVPLADPVTKRPLAKVMYCGNT